MHSVVAVVVKLPVCHTQYSNKYHNKMHAVRLFGVQLQAAITKG